MIPSELCIFAAVVLLFGLSKLKHTSTPKTAIFSDHIHDSNCVCLLSLRYQVVNMLIQEIIEILDVSRVLNVNFEACINYDC